MKRPIFWNDALNEQFIEDGYVVVSLGDASLLDVLHEAYSRFQPDDEFAPETAKTNPLNTSTYHCTFLDTNIDYKRSVQALISEKLKPVIDRHLIDYELLTGNFYVKQVGKGTFQIHQNWPVADYSHTTITVWIPLQDTNVENGTLHVVKGSHKIVPEIASPLSPPYFQSFEQALIEDYLKPVNLKAGEAIIFCDSLIHWSPQNNSDAPALPFR